MTQAQRTRYEKLLAANSNAPLFSDLGFLLNLVRQMDNAARGITGEANNPAPIMSDAKDQARREYIEAFLEKNGLPEKGMIHTVYKGDESNYKTVAIDPIFQPDTAVIHLIPKQGRWMDGQCYDSRGRKVYQD